MLSLSECDLAGRHERCFKSGVTLQRVDCCPDVYNFGMRVIR
jgi:hypothetical protein